MDVTFHYVPSFSLYSTLQVPKETHQLCIRIICWLLAYQSLQTCVSWVLFCRRCRRRTSLTYHVGLLLWAYQQPCREGMSSSAPALRRIPWRSSKSHDVRQEYSSRDDDEWLREHFLLVCWILFRLWGSYAESLHTLPYQATIMVLGMVLWCPRHCRKNCSDIVRISYLLAI